MKNNNHYDPNKRKVVVKIRTEQSQNNEKPSVIDYVADGELIQTPKGWNIVYREASEGQMSDTMTTIVVDDRNITVDRIGIHEMKMDFVEGKHHISRINTPYGAVDVNFMTNKAAARITRQGGRIYLSYIINYNDEFPIKTTLNVSVHPTE